MAFNNLFLLAIRKTKSKSRAISHILIIIYLTILFKDLKDTYSTENYYKFFNIKRNIEKSLLEKNYKRLLAKNHPDRSDTLFSDYNKIQELYEIFGDMKNAGLIKSYKFFKPDIYSDYFDRTTNKDFSYYDFEYSNHMTTNYYIILFMQLFLLKEIKRKNNLIKILFGVFIAVCFIAESSLFGYYSLNKYTEYAIMTIERVGLFDMMTYSEVIEFLKRVLMSLFFIFILFYIEFTKEVKKIELNDILVYLKDKIDRKDVTGTLKETERLKNERERLIKKRISDKRTTALLLVVLCVYGVIYALGI